VEKELYSRTISAEEGKEGYIMVTKDRLSFFPAIGRMFDVQSGSSVRKVKIESYHCECRGPEAPHDHYYVRWPDLKKGDRVLLQKDKKKAGKYILQLHSAVAQTEFCG